MLELVHTESPGHTGYTLAIVFYFACIAVLYVLATFVILPVAKSIFGKTAALVLSHMIA